MPPTSGFAMVGALGSRSQYAVIRCSNPVAKELTVGFAQIGAESSWRTANTDSMKSEAEKRGIKLRFSDAQQEQENQIKAIHTLIAPRRA